MPITVQKLKRVFKFDKNGTVVTLPDPNPDFTVDEVLRFYSPQYPELTTAFIEGPKTDGDTAVYTVNETVGTKG